MSLSSALTTAIAGLRVNQAALSIVSSNVANAKTPGYVTLKPSTRSRVAGGTTGSTVRTTGVNRQLDQYIQSQLRTENAGKRLRDPDRKFAGSVADLLRHARRGRTLETSFTNSRRATGDHDKF